ncbi:MAG: flagellar hook assembly protein FlgD [Rhodocyclaceae bacterium]|nr:flagellar hook assembly protein FlgD [Rhodocyclaceae bacterium]
MSTTIDPTQALLEQLGAKSKTKTSSIDDAESRFLTLLTTQLKNQDPLNPMDNAQMTSQLAQISTVDGVEKLNATLAKLLDSSAGSQTLQAAALVGRGVMVPGSSLSLLQGQAAGGVDLTSAADQVTVTITDANGLVVRTLDLGQQDSGAQGFAWDGKSDSGAVAADGNYKISVSAKQGTQTVTAAALALGGVQSVSRNGQGIRLDLGALGTFTMDDVKQIF